MRGHRRVEAVTDRAAPRRPGVNEAIAEPIVRLAPERSAGEQFEALYQRTFPRVYAYVASMLGDRSAAEEVTAQAFERAYRKRSNHPSGRGSPGAGVLGCRRR